MVLTRLPGAQPLELAFPTAALSSTRTAAVRGLASLRHTPGNCVSVPHGHSGLSITLRVHRSTPRRRRSTVVVTSNLRYSARTITVTPLSRKPPIISKATQTMVPSSGQAAGLLPARTAPFISCAPTSTGFPGQAFIRLDKPCRDEAVIRPAETSREVAGSLASDCAGLSSGPDARREACSKHSGDTRRRRDGAADPGGEEKLAKPGRRVVLWAPPRPKCLHSRCASHRS